MNVGAITYGVTSLPSETVRLEGMEAGQRISPAGGDLPFAKVMNQFLSEVDQHQQVVTQGVNDLAAGKTDNIHEIALNVAQADIAFRMIMEVRDKLISAYQEVMRMQV